MRGQTAMKTRISEVYVALALEICSNEIFHEVLNLRVSWLELVEYIEHAAEIFEGTWSAERLLHPNAEPDFIAAIESYAERICREAHYVRKLADETLLGAYASTSIHFASTPQQEPQ
jgi:hypothetical protein